MVHSVQSDHLSSTGGVKHLNHRILHLRHSSPLPKEEEEKAQTEVTSYQLCTCSMPHVAPHSMLVEAAVCCLDIAQVSAWALVAPDISVGLEVNFVSSMHMVHPTIGCLSLGCAHARTSMHGCHYHSQGSACHAGQFECRCLAHQTAYDVGIFP